MKKLGVIIAAFIFLLLVTGGNVSANHSWGPYHWARTANPFTLKLGNNTSGTWTNFLFAASSDWSASSVLDTNVVSGGTKAKPCRTTNGRVEVCNANYGNNGWLGVAQIWIYGGEHITQGTVRNNDYYFGNSTYQYNNEAEKKHVICQEIGHTLGLDHQSTDGTSLNTCMDYYHNTSNSDTRSTTPNAGDYDELTCIYDQAANGKTLINGTHTCVGTGHLDNFDTVLSIATKQGALFGNGNPDLNDPSAWGKLVRSDNRESLYEKDLGGGNKLFTFVTWAN